MKQLAETVETFLELFKNTWNPVRMLWIVVLGSVV
jgi:hypothetical protein